MATAAQERARLRAIIRSEDIELERALSSATRRTLSAVSKLVRSQARAGPNLSRAWRRPPPAHFKRQFMHGGGRALSGSGGRSSTFHFHLNQTYSGKAGASHQRYIERESACVASFGNIAEEASERERVWEEIESRGAQRKGSFTIGADSDPRLRGAVIKRLAQWRDEGRVAPRIAARTIRMGSAHWPEKGLRIWTHDEKDHARIATWFRQWESNHASQAESEDAPQADATNAGDSTPPAPTQQPLPGFDPAEPAPDEDAVRKRAARAKQLHKDASRKRKLPRGCREFLPRRTTVQRRIILELAHELPLAAQERALHTWCEQELAAQGISYHGVIHQPEGQNDVRNWHAHIVYAPITLAREVDSDGVETGRFTFENEKRLPPMPQRLRELGGNGPDGRRGAGAVIKQWRKNLANIQNTELRSAGESKRYDPRSYRDQGVDRVAGQHVGTKRAALNASGRAVEHWSDQCPEWTMVMIDIENRLETWQASDEERAGVHEAIEEVRLEMGAHTPEAAPHLRAWGLRVRTSLRDEPHAHPRPEEGWQPEVRGLTATIRRIGRECTTHKAPAPWQVAWRAARAKTADPLRLGAVADAIAQGFPGNTEGLAADPRPEARAVGAKARQFRSARARWQERYNSAHAEGEKAITQLATRMAREGIATELVLVPDAHATMVHHIKRAQQRSAVRQTLADATQVRSGETSAGIAARHARIDWDEVSAHLGEASAKRRRQDAATLVAVTAVRELWDSACTDGPAGVERFARHGIVHAQWPSDPITQRLALNALGNEERKRMELAASDPAQAHAEAAAVRAQCTEITTRMRADHNVAEGFAASTEMRSWLEANAPPVWAQVKAAAQSVARARRTLSHRLHTAGIDTESDPAARARACATLDTETAVAIAVQAPQLLKNEHPRLWQGLWAKLKEWGKDVVRQADEGQIEPRWLTESHAALLDTMSERMPGAARVSAHFHEALRAAQHSTQSARASVRTAFQAVLDAPDRTERAKARATLAAQLANPGIRRGIGEGTARRVAYEAGLRERTAPRPAPTPVPGQQVL